VSSQPPFSWWEYDTAGTQVLPLVVGPEIPYIPVSAVERCEMAAYESLANDTVELYPQAEQDLAGYTAMPATHDTAVVTDPIVVETRPRSPLALIVVGVMCLLLLAACAELTGQAMTITGTPATSTATGAAATVVAFSPVESALQVLSVTQGAQTVEANILGLQGTANANVAQVSRYTQVGYLLETDHAATLVVAAGNTTETADAGHATQTADSQGATETVAAHIPTKTAIAATQILAIAEIDRQKAAIQSEINYAPTKRMIVDGAIPLLWALCLATLVFMLGRGVIQQFLWWLSRIHPPTPLEYAEGGVQNPDTGTHARTEARTHGFARATTDGQIESKPISLDYVDRVLRGRHDGAQLPGINVIKNAEYRRLLEIMEELGVITKKPNVGSFYVSDSALDRAEKMIQQDRDNRFILDMNKQAGEYE
jgi:hypothetical protein